jgi:A/G-specific adenine glycosylase
LGIQEQLPVRAAPRERPLKRGVAFVAHDARGAVLLVRRAPNGLLGSMMEPPLGPWAEQFPQKEEALQQAPFAASWEKRSGLVRHGFTHFELEIEAYVVRLSGRRRMPATLKPVWVERERLGEVALPTVMRKIIAHALREEQPDLLQARSARRR